MHGARSRQARQQQALREPGDLLCMPVIGRAVEAGEFGDTDDPHPELHWGRADGSVGREYRHSQADRGMLDHDVVAALRFNRYAPAKFS
jgi:hypothetical protein